MRHHPTVAPVGPRVGDGERNYAQNASSMRFAARDAADGSVPGRITASRVSDRYAYAGVVEHYVYVIPRPEAAVLHTH